MAYNWQWKQREYDLEPGEVLEMPSGTRIEVIRVLGPVATTRLIWQGELDRIYRKPSEIKILQCYYLERLTKVCA